VIENSKKEGCFSTDERWHPTGKIPTEFSYSTSRGSTFHRDETGGEQMQQHNELDSGGVVGMLAIMNKTS
jgi:hypothetical protein